MADYLGSSVDPEKAEWAVTKAENFVTAISGHFVK